MKLAERISRLSPSATLKITALANKMKKEGKEVISFAAGEPDFSTPDFIKQAAIRAIEENFTRYTPSSGMPELRQAICRKLEKENGLYYSPSQVIVSNGAKHSLYNLFQVLCDKGDEVIIPSPYWVSYPQMVMAAEGKPVFVPTSQENNFKLSAAQLKKYLTARTKAMVINSPANPTGAVYTKEELQEVAQLAKEKGIFIISDEIYEKLVFDGLKHISIASLDKEIFALTIVVNGMSKAYAMTGWRIGYLAAPTEIAQAVDTLQSHATSNPSSISQKAALAALEGSQSEIEMMRQEFEKRRNLFFTGLKKIKGLEPFRPQGAFYLFCRISALGLDSLTFGERLLGEYNVALIPGVEFGADDYVRMSFATSQQEIEKGIERIAKFVASL
jgi:aspartate aminotransferase